MNENISNRIPFTIYAWIVFLSFILMIIWVTIQGYRFISGNNAFIKPYAMYLLYAAGWFIIVGIFNAIVKPAYFEACISAEQIFIKTFNPNIRNGWRWLFMPFYSRYLAQYTISTQNYNNYRIIFKCLGIRKNIILQKIENSNLYESRLVPICFLSIRQYTNLIISIERLKEKISLN